MVGYSGGPGLPGGQLADVGGALFAVVGILAAVQERTRTGRGRLVDVALADSAMAFVHMHLAAHLSGGLPLRPGKDILNGGLPCYRLYRTADGAQLAVAALEPRFFSALCERLGRPELAAPAYAGGAEAEAVHQALEALFASAPLATWEARLSGLDACVEAVRAPEDVPADAQFRARGLFVEGTQGERRLGNTPALRAASREGSARAGGGHPGGARRSGLQRSGNGRPRRPLRDGVPPPPLPAVRGAQPCARAPAGIDSRINNGNPPPVSSHFTPEHEAFRQTLRAWVEKELAPHALEWDRAGIFPREVFNKCGSLGVLGHQPRPDVRRQRARLLVRDGLRRGAGAQPQRRRQHGAARAEPNGHADHQTRSAPTSRSASSSPRR